MTDVPAALQVGHQPGWFGGQSPVVQPFDPPRQAQRQPCAGPPTLYDLPWAQQLSTSGNLTLTLPGVSSSGKYTSGPGDLLVAFRWAIDTTPTPTGWTPLIVGTYAVMIRRRQPGDTDVTFAPPSGGCRAGVVSVRRGSSRGVAAVGAGSPGSVSFSYDFHGNLVLGVCYFNLATLHVPADVATFGLMSGGTDPSFSMFRSLGGGHRDWTFNVTSLPFGDATPTLYMVQTVDIQACF